MTAQHCDDCSRPRFPIAPVCPHCGATAWQWRGLTGKGHVFAWVRYHRSYLPEFADLVPYVVITAALEGGVRMIGRLLERDCQPKIGQPVAMLAERWPDGRCVPVFSLRAAYESGTGL